MNKILVIFLFLTVTGLAAFAAEPVSAPVIPDDPEAAGQMLLQQSFQKTDLTEEEAKLRKKEFEAKEKAKLKEIRAIKKIQKKKDKLSEKANAKRLKAAEYEKKIQYRIQKMEEKKQQLETLIDTEAIDPQADSAETSDGAAADTVEQPEVQENSQQGDTSTQSETANPAEKEDENI